MKSLSEITIVLVTPETIEKIHIVALVDKRMNVLSFTNNNFTTNPDTSRNDGNAKECKKFRHAWNSQYYPLYYIAQ